MAQDTLVCRNCKRPVASKDAIYCAWCGEPLYDGYQRQGDQQQAELLRKIKKLEEKLEKGIPTAPQPYQELLNAFVPTERQLTFINTMLIGATIVTVILLLWILLFYAK